MVVQIFAVINDTKPGMERSEAEYFKSMFRMNIFAPGQLCTLHAVL